VKAAVERSGESFVNRLAGFFPEAVRLQIPVNITPLGERALQGESTVIEFGTPQEAIFESKMPLDFEDRVHVKNTDGSIDAEASVVAVQFANGQTAVAVRFADASGNWMKAK
jgi:hypothetical protein